MALWHAPLRCGSLEEAAAEASSSHLFGIVAPAHAAAEADAKCKCLLAALNACATLGCAASKACKMDAPVNTPAPAAAPVPPRAAGAGTLLGSSSRCTHGQPQLLAQRSSGSHGGCFLRRRVVADRRGHGGGPSPLHCLQLRQLQQPVATCLNRALSKMAPLQSAFEMQPPSISQSAGHTGRNWLQAMQSLRKRNPAATWQPAALMTPCLHG